MQLPFAIIPLIHFTSDRARMGAFANRAWVHQECPSNPEDLP
jgi:manganese transport protein